MTSTVTKRGRGSVAWLGATRLDFLTALFDTVRLAVSSSWLWFSSLSLCHHLARVWHRFRLILVEECPPFLTQNASESVRDAYDCLTKAKNKARVYILASMSDILSKKHEIMSLERQKEGEANDVHFRSFTPSSSRSKKIQKKKGRKKKGPTAAAEDKGKAKKTSSLKQLEEGEMTLKVGTEDVILACAVGDAKAKEPLELIHSDLSGPMNVKARGGFEYFISFIDDYSRYGYLYLIEDKSEALEKFKEYKAEVENL
ncbi:gag/pol protein [Cucumis melo var. makuwa]|uniref:Gag/pol protein n=1 Tax=Cucumis melo var. makuwa TaxID=1194695 RepID=A0A5D3DT71_CUCMM|nr:gag/pol protein [Cucumis melo var. makuwa]